MTASANKIMQVAATVLQVLNAVNVSGLPPKAQYAFTGILSAFQAIIGVVAHYYTPEGNKI